MQTAPAGRQFMQGGTDMEKNITIRPERVSDYQQVEDIIRQAFYNLYTPGCTEHYLAHAIRTHPDFLPELDLVLELDGRVVGNIMYTKSTLVDEAGKEKGILTFGPVCIRPGLQRRGYGRLLMEESFRRASAMGYEAIVIFGDPNNYVGRGFQSCKKHRVHLEDGTYPAAMLVKELEPGTLAGKSWIYRQSPAFVFDEAEARRFDDSLPPMEKKRLPCQEAFEILSSAVLL